MAFLEVKDVSFKPDDLEILHDINLVVAEHDFLTITGPSGSGKSTLLKMVASLLTPTKGEIIFQGKTLESYPITEYRKLVSYCFQQPVLFGKTVEDNLAFPYLVRNVEPDLAQMQAVLPMVNLPESYLKKKIIELSGGEKQRVAMLRNTMFPPKVLLLDEVMVGLDEDSKVIVQHFIEKMYEKGMTVLQVTHDSEEIRAAKKIVVIVQGRVKNG